MDKDSMGVTRYRSKNTEQQQHCMSIHPQLNIVFFFPGDIKLGNMLLQGLIKPKTTNPSTHLPANRQNLNTITVTQHSQVERPTDTVGQVFSPESLMALPTEICINILRHIFDTPCLRDQPRCMCVKAQRLAAAANRQLRNYSELEREIRSSPGRTNSLPTITYNSTLWFQYHPVAILPRWRKCLPVPNPDEAVLGIFADEQSDSCGGARGLLQGQPVLLPYEG